jgi:glycosyltransferase involved in cell wall biosynthesis
MMPNDVAAAGVWIVVPAFNEATVLGDVIANLRRHYPQVVVVDDCSTDGTGAAAAGAGAVVVRHPINLGQGAALQTGIDVALARGAAFIVTFDADGQHRAGDIPVLLDALNAAGADYALGSRFLGQAINLPRSRLLLLKAATLFTRLTTGLAVTDAHNGFRAMTRRGATMIRIRQNRMAHASEVMHQIAASGLNYVEAPVTIEYSAYSLAKGQKFSNSLNILMDLAIRRLHR